MHKRMAETEESVPNLQDNRLEHREEAEDRMMISQKSFFFLTIHFIIKNERNRRHPQAPTIAEPGKFVPIFFFLNRICSYL